MTRYRFLPEALADLEEAAAWYEDQRPGLGAELLDEFQSRIGSATRWPDTGSLSGTTTTGFGAIAFAVSGDTPFAGDAQLCPHRDCVRAFESPPAILDCSGQVVSSPLASRFAVAGYRLLGVSAVEAALLAPLSSTVRSDFG